jgi:hypothetical protein
LELAVLDILMLHNPLCTIFFKIDYDELQAKKNGIGIDAYLRRCGCIGYWDVAEKKNIHTLIQQSFIQIFKLPKKICFLPIRYFLSFTFLHNTKDIICFSFSTCL